MPLGFVSNGNGGLGFGFAGAIGLRMALPDRPVVAVIGDGSAMFGIQALWSAAQYGVGVLLIVMANGAYGVMDAQAHARGGKPAWPQFPGVGHRRDRAGARAAQRCASKPTTSSSRHLTDALDGLRDATAPLLIEVVVAP